MERGLTYRPLEPGMGEAVAARTILRTTDGRQETWGEVADRVAFGNTSLAWNQHGPDEVMEEYRRLRDHIAFGRVLMSGRHLQHGDALQPQRNLELFSNCSTAAASFIKFYLLLNGSGVGRSYDDALMVVDWNYLPQVVCVLSKEHPDYRGQVTPEEARERYPSAHWFEVPDSREGWAKAVELMERMAFERVHANEVLVLDFSKVRPKGSPIGGMQNRPASGPVPLMEAIEQVHAVKGKGYEPWEQAMRIDHALAACVAVGGARRAARIAIKDWRDPGIFKFIDIKQQGGLWSANNSIGVDAEFWKGVEAVYQAKEQRRHVPLTKEEMWAYDVFLAATKAQFEHGTGEPGFINLDRLNTNEEGLERYADGEFTYGFKYRVDPVTERVLLKRVYEGLLRSRYKFVVNPCGEVVLLATGGYCVHGDTRILTRNGYVRIRDVVGQEVEVFNGEEWSKVRPFQTGSGQKLLRVTFSDGSYLDCTDYHRFSIRRWRQSEHFDTVEARNLRPGDILPSFRVPPDIAGISVEDAYTYGAFLGDGNIYERGDVNSIRAEIVLYPGKHHLPVTGTRGAERKNDGGIRVTVSHLDEAWLRSLKGDELPEWVFRMDYASTVEFIKGWLDTDGTYHKRTGGVSIDTTKQRALGLQLLLRRIGISYASVRRTASVGDVTNFGARTQDQYRVYIPQSEAGLIRGYRVASDAPVDLDRVVRQQRVVSVERLPGLHDTFCFTEPKRNMGVFGNVLTYQCVIADVVPFFADDLDQARDAFLAATRALIRTNLMQSLYQKEVERTNRIGVGMTGIQEFAWKFFGLTFRDLIADFDYLMELSESSLERIARTPMLRTKTRLAHPSFGFWLWLWETRKAVEAEADRYSDELGVTRPHTVTTIKPAGTTSKLFLLTEGAHLPAQTEFLRWVQFQKGDPLIAEYEAKGYPTQEVEQYPDVVMVGFPTQPMICRLGIPRERLVTASEATMEEQYKWVQLLEKFWLGPRGNQVSYTLKYDREAMSLEDYRSIILTNQPHVRAISVLPSSDWRRSKEIYGYVPEEPISLEEFRALESRIDTRARETIALEDLQCASGACPL